MPKKTPMDYIRPLVDMIKMHKKQYDSGDTDYSVTTLIQPPRIVHLNRRYGDKIKTYVFDNLASFIGTAIHNYAEALLNKVPGKSYLCEQRLRTVMLGRKISGAFDILNKFDMYDIKTCSTWKIIFGTKDDWTAQQNMYHLLFHQKHKITLEHLYVLGVFLDWTLYKMMQSGKEYPREKCQLFNLPIWSFSETQEYMERRIQLMIDNENVADDDLPPCTSEEMWADADTWAVKRHDRKRALRVLAGEVEARGWMNNYVEHNPDKVKLSNLFIEHRLGRRKRCMDWCPVNVHCNHFHKYMTEVNLNEDKAKR
jgi:hypothetical protein